ncbi:MAG: sugar transferase [Lentisphaeria bacterium]|nr:sugar transferase [Lentisphaeria bacterium]
MYEGHIKRPLDLLCSLAALIFLSPVLLVVALLVRIKLGSPVFFTQERPGVIDPETDREKIFRLVKFRTMTDERDVNGELLPDEKRLTSFGKFLRSTSLDELPELLNIIKGDMSIVGPRPLLVKYLERYTPTQRRRQEVRPGLTGLAMSTVRNSQGWDKKFELDVQYVDNVTFLLDVKIILWTVRIVLKREGINEPGCATNAEFMGTLKKK